MSLLKYIVCPLSKEALLRFDSDCAVFFGGSKYPLVDSIPILIDEKNGLFDINGIIAQKPLTQNRQYLDKRKFKNYVRRNMLPSLSSDVDLKSRYEKLALQAKGLRVLVIGAGEKVAFYKGVFKESEVITSDVHMQFRPDVVFDVHAIPFPNDFFHLVIAAQVIEHTMRPWVAAKEMERVCTKQGVLQIEVPFAFPYHAAPYDFFRFTFTGMRSLFPSCQVVDYKATEGPFSAAAVVNAQALIEVSSISRVRQLMVVIGRLIFFWLKFLDRRRDGRRLSDFIMPKGYYITFLKDGVSRTDSECLRDFDLLSRK